MNVPPYLIDMHVTSKEGARHHFWIPLFLLWPLLLVLAVLAFILTLLVDVALMASGQRYHYYTFLLAGCFEMLSDLSGTTVYVRNPDTFLDLVIK